MQTYQFVGTVSNQTIVLDAAGKTGVARRPQTFRGTFFRTRRGGGEGEGCTTHGIDEAERRHPVDDWATVGRVCGRSSGGVVSYQCGVIVISNRGSVVRGIVVSRVSVSGIVGVVTAEWEQSQ